MSKILLDSHGDTADTEDSEGKNGVLRCSPCPTCLGGGPGLVARIRSAIRHGRSEVVHPIEATDASAVDAGSASSLAALLTRHILQDGELVVLMLKPSLWYILLSSLRFIAVILIGVIAAKIYEERLDMTFLMVELGIFLIAGRLMWATLQWMGRLYILTDLRIVRLSGVFAVDIYDCPLRKVARTRVIRSVRETLLRLGSIEIIPQDDSYPFGLWQTVAQPVAVNDQVVAAINRAKQGGRTCDA